jgi:hypothetical protein
MGAYDDAVDLLETELNGVADIFPGLTEEQWARPTLLVPENPDLPTVRLSPNRTGG